MILQRNNNMNIVFITNIISSHQIELWKHFSNFNNIKFTYLFTEIIRKNDNRYYCKKEKFCIHSKNINDIKSFLDKQDIYILSKGSIYDQRIKNYKFDEKRTIVYSEHCSKNIDTSSLLSILKYRINLLLFYFKNKNSKKGYLLSASSHAGNDYRMSGYQKKNIYRFGYFPLYLYNKTFSYNKQIVFAGRNLPFKHVEDSYYVLSVLNKKDNAYKLIVAGKGFNDNEESKNITYLNEISRYALLNLLLNSEIFVFSSTREEGWGVVLGEAMAAGCVVFANKNAGSTNFLVKDSYNGFTYRTKKELNKKIEKYYKLSDTEKNEIRKNAVNTIKNNWDSKIASERLYRMCISILKNERIIPYKDGPISKDPCKF